MLPEKSSHLFAFVGDAFSNLRVENVVTRHCVPINDVLAFVKTAFECYTSDALLFASADKIFFFIIEYIKERPGDCLDYRGFSRSVWPRDGRRTA